LSDDHVFRHLLNLLDNRVNHFIIFLHCHMSYSYWARQ